MKIRILSQLISLILLVMLIAILGGCGSLFAAEQAIDQVEDKMEQKADQVEEQIEDAVKPPVSPSVTQNAADNNDVIYVPTDNTAANNAGVIDNICRPAGVPILAGEEALCAGCGVAALTISYYDLGTATGKMAAKVLTGDADISQMPIEYAPAVTPKYNAEICKSLGITVPDGYLPIEM